jgi:putative ABC transport system ATP-binding protein
VVVSTHDDRIVPLADRVIELTGEMVPVAGNKKKKLKAGEVLFEEGTRGALIYIVNTGTIDILRPAPGGGEQVVASYGPKEYFGELGPLLGFARAGTARARVPTSVTGYTVPEFRGMVGADKIASLLGKAGAKRKGNADGPARKPARKANARKGGRTRPRG